MKLNEFLLVSLLVSSFQQSRIILRTVTAAGGENSRSDALDKKNHNDRHVIAKRAQQDLGLSLQCTPQWNSTTERFTVIVQWTASNDELISQVNSYHLQYYEEDNGLLTDIGSIRDLGYTQANSGRVFSHVDENLKPLNSSTKAVYTISTTWRDTAHNGHDTQRISLAPLVPSPVNLSLLSHLFHKANTPQSTVITLTHVHVSWTINDTDLVEISSLGYQASIGPSAVGPNHSYVIDNVTQVDTTHFEGLLIHLNSLVISSQSSFICLKLRSIYTVRTGDENITFYSEWSQQLNLSLTQTSSTSVLTSSTSVLTSSPTIPTSPPTIPTSPPTIPTSTSADNMTPIPTSLYHTRSSSILATNPSPGNVNKSSGMNRSTAIIASVLCIAVLLVVAMVVIGICLLKLRHNRRKFREISDYLEDNDNGDMTAIFYNKKQPSVSLMSQKSEPQMELTFSLHMDEWEIPMDAVEFDQPLGEGCFGEVYLGRLREDYTNPLLASYSRHNDTRGFIAIKLLKSTASSSEKNDFLKEIELMKKISKGKNPRVVNMLGAVTIQEPMLLVTEFVIHGDLLTYLRACRKKMVFHRQPAKAYDKDDESGEGSISLGVIDATDLVSFAYQITSGMDYLASLQVVHRDLACRNILVGEGKSLKITDFGMSRMIYNDSSYVKTTKGKLPLKWMAIESIVDRIFTSASDVWSFGICLWEIATLGHIPYPTVGNEDLLPMLTQGHRMEKPSNCSDEIYKIMLMCWQGEPDDRPTFTELRKQFDAILSKQRNFNEHYIDLSLSDPVAAEMKESCCQSTTGSFASCTEVDQPQLMSSPSRLSNVYVDSPTHSDNETKDRPTRLSLPGQPQHPFCTGSATTPGGQSLPAVTGAHLDWNFEERRLSLTSNGF